MHVENDCRNSALGRRTYIRQSILYEESILQKIDFNYAVLPCKLSCDSRFQRAFTACVSVFKAIILVGSSQHYYFENAKACSKHMLKTTVAT